MLEKYSEMPTRYKAHFVDNQLIVEEVGPDVYMRVGYHGAETTKLRAVETLRKGMMEEFLRNMSTIQWQAKQYID